MNEQESQVQENDHAAMEIRELRSPSTEENANGGDDIGDIGDDDTQIEEMNLEGNGERDNNQGQLRRTVRKRPKAHEDFEGRFNFYFSIILANYFVLINKKYNKNFEYEYIRIFLEYIRIKNSNRIRSRFNI